MKKSNILLCCSLFVLASCSADTMNKFVSNVNSEMAKSDMKPINTASWAVQDCNNWRNIGKSVQTAWQGGENKTRIYDRVKTHTNINLNQASNNDVIIRFKEVVDMAFKVKMYDKQSDKDQVINTTGSNFNAMCNFYKRKESENKTTSTTITQPSRPLKTAPTRTTTTQPSRTLKTVPAITTTTQPSRTIKIAP